MAGKAGAWQRAEAARVVDAVVEGGRSLDAALADAAGRLAADDLPLVRFLAYGTLRNHWRLEWQLGRLLERPLKPKDRIVAALLRTGLFQLSESRVPDHAAVSMTVEATRLLRKPKYAGLVNAVLRNQLRGKAPDAEPDDPAARFNHPAWLIERLQADWPDDWQRILEAGSRQAPMWLRVNARYGSAADYLAANALAGRIAAGLPQALRLDAAVPVDRLPGFADGVVSVQDGAAQIAAPWLLAGGTEGPLLDACAAPGGKTGQLAELAPDGTELVAVDNVPERAAAIADNLERLGLNATVRVADASHPRDWWDGRLFGRILLDAPCSATGVIRRHPDIACLRREADVGGLAARQQALLDALWPLLRPGGRLLYVTCSVLAAENDDVVSAFLAGHPDAGECRVLHDYNIRALMCAKRAGYQVLPGTEDMDGFYFACLDKAAPDGTTSEE